MRKKLSKIKKVFKRNLFLALSSGVAILLHKKGREQGYEEGFAEGERIGSNKPPQTD
jgi:hypothetical protein